MRTAVTRIKIYEAGVLVSEGAGFIDFTSGADVTSSGDGVNIDITGGGSSSFTKVAVTGTRNDSNLVFASAVEPELLSVAGMLFAKTGGWTTWTWGAGVITLNNPVGTGNDIFGLKY